MKQRNLLTCVGFATALTLFGCINACAEPSAEEHIVTISSFEFAPKELAARVGDTITWINKDIVPHTATSADGTWDTGAIKQDDSVSLTVTKEMTSSYFCRFHTEMIGSVLLAR